MIMQRAASNHEWNGLIDWRHTCTRRLIVGAKAPEAAALSVGAEAPEAAAERHDLVCSEASVNDEERDFDVTKAHELAADDRTVGQFAQRRSALNAR